VEDESKLEPWDVVKDINNYIPCSYDKVKHLEDTVVSPTPGIEIRTAMEYCRMHNMDIKKHFDLSKTINELVFKQMVKVSPYRDIPKENRGRALNNTPHST
jgi:hypothetical protein